MFRPSQRAPRLLLSTALAASTLLWGCSSDSDATAPEPPSDPTPTTITVTPTTALLAALGATQQIAAAVLDESGQPIPGATVVWASADAAVATVSETGLITAVGEGATMVSATSGSLSAEVTVTVKQAPANVSVTPVSSELLPGASVTLAASVADANGNAIPSPPTVGWSTSDAAVATVDQATGVVTAVAEGSATITATSGGASGTAGVTVLAPPPDLVFDADGTLGGMVNAGSVTIQPGVTVTLTEDLVLNTSGSVSIQGTLTGDCMAIDALIGGDLTLNGATLDTSCGVLPEPEDAPGLTLEAAGALTLQASQVTSAGEVLISNDPGFVPEDEGFFPPTAGGSATPRVFGRSSGVRSSFAAPEGTTMAMEGGNCVLTDVMIDVETTAAPDEAGVDINPDDGLFRNLLVRCEGDLVADNVTLEGRDGADGEPVSVAAPAPVVEGANGQWGGGAVLSAGGDVTVTGVVTLLGGDGGNGATVIAIATEPGAAAEAHGGGGGLGLPGWVIGNSLTIAPNGELVIGIGRDGHGGAAGAQGANGAPGQAGGAALAVGGDPGSRRFVLASPFFEALILQAPIDAESRNRVGILPFVAGNGGEVEVVAGRGGDGPSPGAPGAPGGNAEAVGGRGGKAPIALNAPLSMPVEVTLGDGGNATWRGGRGGDGAPDVCEPGGEGGRGGDASGRAGEAGTTDVATGLAITPGTPGVGTLDAFGHGGNGADGTGGGDAGAGGGNATEAPTGGVAPDPAGSFLPGGPGADLPCAFSTLMDLIWQVASDPSGHAPFVNFQSVANAVFVFEAQELLLTLRESGPLFSLSGAVTGPSGAPGGPAGAVTPGIFTFSLSGTGMAAGFPGVLVTFDGTLEVDDQGNIRSLSGEMVIDANNNVLPPNEMGQRNPLVYDVSATPTPPDAAGR
ncbi:MAG: Ig-like domain-containing protein [Gemmatimonadota bacterium]